MQWNIPGTVLTAEHGDTPQIQERISSMFLGGGIVLSQVSAVTGLEPHTIQNWVKRGFLARPVGKKYTLRQFCRILNINMLKDALRMEEVLGLMTYVNGRLDDDGDDLIDDSQLYFLFLRLARKQQMCDSRERDEAIREILADYREPVPGARERVAKALRVRHTAWAASLLCRQANAMAAELKKETNL